MSTKVYDLRTNFQEEPVLKENEEIYFSWKLDSTISNVFQQSYEIIVSNGKGLIWTSGEVQSKQTVNILYDGPKLEPEKKYEWKISIRTNLDENVIESKKQYFYTFSKWEDANWITYKGKKSFPEFTSQFLIKEKEISDGLLYISSLGSYDAEINGESVGISNNKKKEILNPGWTDYLTQINYQCFDLKDLLQHENIINISVANGWFLGDISKHSNYEDIFSDGIKKHSLIAKLVVYYTDGTKDIFTTDNKNWFVNEKQYVVENDLYHGEVVDYSYKPEKQYEDVISPKFNQNAIKNNLVPNNSVKIYQHYNEKRAPERIYYYNPNEIMEDPNLELGYYNIQDLNTNKDFIIKPGLKYVLDFGQNMAGTFSIKFQSSSEARNKLRIRTAEMINDGMKNRENEDYGSDGPKYSVYRQNLSFESGGECRSEEIIYTNDTEVKDYTPYYTYHGYRYLEVSVEHEMTIKKIYQLPISSLTTPKTKFKSNNQAVNQLFENTIWSQRSNYMSLPTDCPQRSERAGWTGDVQIFLKTALRNFDSIGFLSGYLESINSDNNKDIYDSIIPKSFIPDLAETIGAGWSDIGIILPWELYKFTNNIEFLKKYYKKMNSYMVGIGDLNSSETIYNENIFGDWLSFAPASTPFINLVYRAYCAQIMEKVSTIMKDAEMKEKYRKLYEIIKDTIQRNYVEENNDEFVLLTKTTDGVDKSFHDYEFVDNAQAGLLWFLKLKLYNNNDQKQKAVNVLIESIKNENRSIREHLPENSHAVGFLGINILLPVLSEIGEESVAYDLLLSEEIPSWLYSVNNGATTIWERWNSYSLEDSFGDASMNSFNHYSYGSVFEWVYNQVAGVKINPTSKDPIVISPKIDKGTKYNNQERINEVLYEYDSILGKIKVHWKSEEEKLKTLKVTIPANQTGILHLNKKDIEDLDLSQYKVKNIDDTEEIVEIELNSETVFIE